MIPAALNELALAGWIVANVLILLGVIGAVAYARLGRHYRHVLWQRDRLQDRWITWTKCPECGRLVACMGVPCRVGHCRGCGRNVTESEIDEVDPGDDEETEQLLQQRRASGGKG